MFLTSRQAARPLACCVLVLGAPLGHAVVLADPSVPAVPKPVKLPTDSAVVIAFGAGAKMGRMAAMSIQTLA